MFSWASGHIEKLTNTLAPPPTDAAGRFVYCCQRDEESEAIACVAELPGAGCIVKPAKGQLPLHVACESSMPNLIRMLLQQPGATLELRDIEGNTPLHVACTSNKPNALDVVKMLVSEFEASVTTKNNQGQTPYDVAQLNVVRQYLLPIQLQKETQEALDNGGAGLPPGIDLGGLKISNQHLPPPPVGGVAGGPPVGPHGTAPPQVGGQMGAGPPPAAAAVPPPIGGAPSMMTPPPAAAQMFTTPTPTNDRFALPPTDSAKSPVATDPPVSRSPPPPAPTSGPHAYATSGYSSAAIYKPKGTGLVQPDGFHSSSSDKRLQEKYGHAPVGYGTNRAVPPPPSSGNAPSPALVHPQSAPPSLGSNPYAGGVSALGGPTRPSNRRYVAIDPVTGQSMVPPPAPATTGGTSGYASYSSFPTPPGAGSNFTMFNPASNAAPSPALAVSTPLATVAAPSQSRLSASIGPVTPHMPPPSYQTQSQQQQAMPVPAVLAAPVAVAPDPTQQTPPPHGTGGAAAPTNTSSPTGLPMRSNSAESAENVFSSPSLANPAATSLPNADPSPPIAAADRLSMTTPGPSAAGLHAVSTESAASVFSAPQLNAVSAPPGNTQGAGAASLFASPPADAPDMQNVFSAPPQTSVAPQPAPASDVFSKPQTSSTDLVPPAAGAPSISSKLPAANVGEEPQPSVALEGEGLMQDVPLSPDSKNTESPAGGGGDKALYSAIGMPPPPFSRK